jgi:DNA polymerase-3 subunit epsilon
MLSVAVATIEHQQLRIDRLWNRIVFQRHAAVNDAVKVHGILPSESSHGIAESAMLEELLPLLTGAIVVGHHVRFDAAMLHAAMERHFGLRFRNRLLDTGDLAMAELDAFKKSAYSNQRPPSLDEVCQQLEIDPVDRHTALGDAFTTAQVFLYLRGRMQQRLQQGFQRRHLPLGKF